MTAMNGTRKPEIIERPRARRNAAKVLALTWQNRLRALYDAQSSNDEDAIVIATANLAQAMYENIEFAIWALKTVAGMSPPPPEMLKSISPSHVPPAPPANDPKPETVLDLPCTCPPLEHGILFRERHMTSCPKFVP
jgi:hypothetical protein